MPSRQRGAGSIPASGTLNAGLCATCRFVRVIVTRTGSRFFYCRLSDTDDRFVKYPVVPVLECSGYIDQQVRGEK